MSKVALPKIPAINSAPKSPDLFNTSPRQGPADEMDRYGITPISVTYYRLGKYRYTNLEDAIAEAERDAMKQKPV